MTLAIIVIEVVAILANLGLPFYQGMALKFKAADIARAMQQVGTAAESAREHAGTWPDDRSTGMTPPELTAFLPPGFTFAHADYQLDWDHWTVAESPSLDAVPEELAGITVVTRDPRLAAMVASELHEGEVRFTLGNSTTLVVAEPGSAER
jgi:type II secretory pathway pseudopilin PulG